MGVLYLQSWKDGVSLFLATDFSQKWKMAVIFHMNATIPCLWQTPVACGTLYWSDGSEHDV